MTSLIAAGGSGRSTSVIPAVPAASSVTTIAFIPHLRYRVLAFCIVANPSSHAAMTARRRIFHRPACDSPGRSATNPPAQEETMSTTPDDATPAIAEACPVSGLAAEFDPFAGDTSAWYAFMRRARREE